MSTKYYLTVLNYLVKRDINLRAVEERKEAIERGRKISAKFVPRVRILN